MSSSDDAVLLGRWRAGDAAAGEALLDRHYARLARFFRNKVSEPVEDLVQQTLLACVEGRDRVRDPERFTSYLFGVAHNVLRRFYETRAGRPGALERSVHDLAPSPSMVAARGEQERLLLEALRRVPLEHQVVLELSFWEELSSAEIGAALGLPATTVRSRLTRGKALLGERMRQLAGSPVLARATLSDLDRWAAQVRARLGEP